MKSILELLTPHGHLAEVNINSLNPGHKEALWKKLTSQNYKIVEAAINEEKDLKEIMESGLQILQLMQLVIITMRYIKLPNT